MRRLSKRKKSREPIHSAPILSLPPIIIAEMEIAELEFLRNVRQFHFPEELELLSKVRGRLSLASTAFETKHQIILPKNDHMANLVVEYYHQISGHSGREYVISVACEKFWIINASSVVRKVLSKCFSCRRRQGPVCKQKMVDLPVDHVTPCQPPFTSVSIDCFGPFGPTPWAKSCEKTWGHFHMPCNPCSTP